MLPQRFQHYSQMLLMLFLALGVDQYVVYEDQNKMIQKLMKNAIHQPHKGCWRICQSER